MTPTSFAMPRQRKVHIMTHLRDDLLWEIDLLVWEKKKLRTCRLRLKNAVIEAVIRPLSNFGMKLRRVFEIRMHIVEYIRDAAGKAKRVFHNFTIELPVEMGEVRLK